MEINFEGLEVGDDVKAKLNERVTAAVATAIDTEVKGLKAKNNELLGASKTAADKLKEFDGIDPIATRKLLDDMKKNNDLALLKDGRLDELIASKVKDVKARHDDEMKKVTEERDKLQGGNTTLLAKYQQRVVGDAVTKEALKANILPTAVDDVTRRAMELFTVNEAGELEARDKDGALLKTSTGDLLTTARFIEALQKDAPHYWPGSEGAGLKGGAAGPSTDIEKQLLAAADSNNMAEYRRLRELQKKAAKG